jgi:hypothetical protein
MNAKVLYLPADVFFLDKFQRTAYKMIEWLLYSYIIANMWLETYRSRPLGRADGPKYLKPKNL